MSERENGQVRPIGVVGLGVVGGTVARAFEATGVRIRGYDRYRGIGEPADLSGCPVILLCVPTAIGEDGHHDLTEVWAAVGEIEPHLDRGAILAVKSTLPPGTCDALAAEFAGVRMAYVPEFLVATNPMETFTHPARVVIGSNSEEVATTLGALLSRVAPAAPVITLKPIEAELVKLCANAMLATKVTMANELAEVCGRFDAAWPTIQAVVGLDRRIAPDHLTVTAERGFGGTCLPKDLDGLIAASRSAGYEPTVLSHIAEFNRRIRDEGAVSASVSHSEARGTEGAGTGLRSGS